MPRSRSPSRASPERVSSQRSTIKGDRRLCANPICNEERAKIRGEVAPFCSKECEVEFYGHSSETKFNHIYRKLMGKATTPPWPGFSRRSTSPLASRHPTPPRSSQTVAMKESAKCDIGGCNNSVSGYHMVDGFSFCSNRCYQHYSYYEQTQ